MARRSRSRDYPRTARLNELLREIIAAEDTLLIKGSLGMKMKPLVDAIKTASTPQKVLS